MWEDYKYFVDICVGFWEWLENLDIFEWFLVIDWCVVVVVKVGCDGLECVLALIMPVWCICENGWWKVLSCLLFCG